MYGAAAAEVSDFPLLGYFARCVTDRVSGAARRPGIEEATPTRRGVSCRMCVESRIRKSREAAGNRGKTDSKVTVDIISFLNSSLNVLVDHGWRGFTSLTMFL